MRARVEHYYAMWEESGRDASRLLPGGLPLEEGRQLMEGAALVFDDKLKAFVSASCAHHEERERRTVRRRKWAFAVLGGLTATAMTAGFVAYVKGREAGAQRIEALKQKEAATARSRELSDTLGVSYFHEGSARLRDNGTAREGLAYLARGVREHQHQTSANRLLTFLQQHSTWILEDVGEVRASPATVKDVPVQLPHNLGFPDSTSNGEPGQVGITVRGPQGQVAVSWREDMDSNRGSGHPGMGLHHFRVWNNAGISLTDWIKADFPADHWVGDISGMTFSPEGTYLAVTVERWRQPEYLQIYDLRTSQIVGETLVATGEHPNSQGAAFTLVAFAPERGEPGNETSELIAGSSRGDAYWMRLTRWNAEPEASEIAIVPHGTSIRAALVLPGEDEQLVTGSEDGEVRFTVSSELSVGGGAPSLKLQRPIDAIRKGDEGSFLVESGGREYLATMVPPVSFPLKIPAAPKVADGNDVSAEIIDDEYGIRVIRGGVIQMERKFLKKVTSADIEIDPASLHVTLEDGTIQEFLLGAGEGQLIVTAKGNELVISPANSQHTTTFNATLVFADLQSGKPCNRVVTATNDFVYQVFDAESGLPLSKPLNERWLFERGGAASDIDTVLLSPSASALLTKSQHWEPPNLMIKWSTLWDCASGEPLSERVTFADDGGSEQPSVDSLFLNDEIASVGGNLLYRASPEMFPVLAKLAEALAGMQLDGAGELRPLVQSARDVRELLKRVTALRP